MRQGNRSKTEIRKVNIERNFMNFAEGSCLIEVGNTKVVCTGTIEESVPPFLKGQKTGWITAEYGMLPRSCKTRIIRESSRGRVGGRTHEVQRLIGRSLRTVVDLTQMGERTIWIDCDVIQADGGTRCASITGSFIALCDSLIKLKKQGVFNKIPVSDWVAAISIGIVKGELLLDLDYEEDCRAEVDMNIVMTGSGKFIEVQGTAEKEPFSNSQMDNLLGLAKKGVEELIGIQKKLLGKDIGL